MVYDLLFKEGKWELYHRKNGPASDENQEQVIDYFTKSHKYDSLLAVASQIIEKGVERIVITTTYDKSINSQEYKKAIAQATNFEQVFDYINCLEGFIDKLRKVREIVR